MRTKEKSHSSCVTGAIWALAVLFGCGAPKITDGTPGDDFGGVRTFSVRADELPAAVSLTAGELILQAVRQVEGGNLEGGDLELELLWRTPWPPSHSALADPRLYSGCAPPRLVDDAGRACEFRRDAKATDKLTPGFNILRAASKAADGQAEMRVTCRFAAPAADAQELTFTFPGGCLLTREHGSKVWKRHEQDAAAFVVPSSVIEAISSAPGASPD